MSLRGRLQSDLTNRCHGNDLCVEIHTWGQSHWWGQFAFSHSSSVPLVSLKSMSNLIRALLVFRCANSRTEGKLCHMRWQCLSHSRNHTRSHSVSGVFSECVWDYGFQEELCWFYEKLNDKVICDMLCFSSILYTQQDLAKTQRSCFVSCHCQVTSHQMFLELFSPWKNSVYLWRLHFHWKKTVYCTSKRCQKN